MSITTGVIIFTLAFVLLSIELIAYFFLGALLITRAPTMSMPFYSAASGWLMGVTAAIGIFALIGALIEKLAAKRHLGWYILGAGVLLSAVLVGMYQVIGFTGQS